MKSISYGTIALQLIESQDEFHTQLFEITTPRSRLIEWADTCQKITIKK
jgi:hypothetical protein